MYVLRIGANRICMVNILWLKMSETNTCRKLMIVPESNESVIFNPPTSMPRFGGDSFMTFSNPILFSIDDAVMKYKYIFPGREVISAFRAQYLPTEYVFKDISLSDKVIFEVVGRYKLKYEIYRFRVLTIWYDILKDVEKIRKEAYSYTIYISEYQIGRMYRFFDIKVIINA